MCDLSLKKSLCTVAAEVEKMPCFVAEVWQTFVVGERVVFVVSCQTHSFASSQRDNRKGLQDSVTA